MIYAHFFKSKGYFTSFSIEGHAGYAECGEDIVCSAVTSAVMTVLNGITEFTDADAEVEVNDNEIVLNLANRNQSAQSFLDALKLQLDYIEEQYGGTINITVTEV
ncbi:MAG: ribosomal-processing cysteine protease Prp [Oscillospiraceae bacterium]|nr:ribosomal-processing cysteine protease Prp [Oscillospiraceae bacterium]